MAGRAYVDFDVTLRAVGAQYEVQVRGGAGSASNQFPLPFSDRELDDFFSMFGRRVRRIESPQLERARALGGRLYKAVFNDELDALLAASLTQAGETDHGLRIRLRMDEAPDLVNIPWEYLYRPDGDDFLALSNWTPIVRFMNIEARMPPAPLEAPLRILVMISNPIEYHGTLDVEREWERLQDSLADLVAAGQVELHRLEHATESELLGELRRDDYHIFHFVGHGEFDEKEQDGVLVLEDERRHMKLVTGRALGTNLRDSRSMRLVVLNNCEGATASATDPFAGAAQSLLQKGIPAVAAMQFEITDDAAISFSHEFYAGISDGYPADAAVAEARKAIYNGVTKFEFGSPVLYLSADDGVIFNIATRAKPAMGSDAPATRPEAAAAPAPPDPPPLTEPSPGQSAVADLEAKQAPASAPTSADDAAAPHNVALEPVTAGASALGQVRRSLSRRALVSIGAIMLALVVVVTILITSSDDPAAPSPIATPDEPTAESASAQTTAAPTAPIAAPITSPPTTTAIASAVRLPADLVGISSTVMTGFGGNPEYTVPVAPADLSVPPGGCEGLAEWATELGGAPTSPSPWGTVGVGVVIQGTSLLKESGVPVAITGLTVDVASWAPPLTGSRVGCQPLPLTDGFEPLTVGVVLPASQGGLVATRYSQEGDPLETFPRQLLAGGETLAIDLWIDASGCFCEWTATLHTVVDGKQADFEIDDNGKPFRMTGGSQAVPFLLGPEGLTSGE